MDIGGGNTLLSFYKGIGAYSHLIGFNMMERNHLKNQPFDSPQANAWGLPSTRDFGELSRATQAEGLRVDTERRFQLCPKWRSLAQSKYQRGVSLVIALMILLVLTLIGISAISTTTFETNIAGNERLYNKAFYTSDAGVDYFVSMGVSYLLLPNSLGIVDSRTDGIPLGGDYFLVNWDRRVSDLGPPKKYEFKITSQGISPSFPAAGRINIEAIVEVVDTTPPEKYQGD
jgi:hypothetical protein